MRIEEFPGTVFLDIDGTLIEHNELTLNPNTTMCKGLPGVKEFIKDCIDRDWMIVLTTGRKESRRDQTEAQLKVLGIQYDTLLMGLPRGQRIVVNDAKPSDPNFPMAASFCPERNEGLARLNIPYVPEKL